MRIDTTSLPTDAHAVRRAIEGLSARGDGGPVLAGFNTLAKTCTLTRDRAREMVRLLIRRGIISEVQPPDPSVGRPAAYLVNTAGAGGA